MQDILRYFPDLSAEQQMQLAALDGLYRDWNAKINVISRRDIDNLYTHHVLHSLAIAKAIRFRAGSRVLDIGTGGGFPGIPLAILFPDVHFCLIDSIGKKVRVAAAVAESIGLANVTTAHCNVVEHKDKYDFVVSRGVMPLPDLARLVRKNIAREQRNALPGGLICLKGGDLQAELQPFRRAAEQWRIADFFPDIPFFDTKQVVYVALGVGR